MMSDDCTVLPGRYAYVYQISDRREIVTFQTLKEMLAYIRDSSSENNAFLAQDAARTDVGRAEVG